MNINTHDKYFNDFIYLPIPNLHGYEVFVGYYFYVSTAA